jgi:glycosyltransferase involved in cell wall biosynthesis
MTQTKPLVVSVLPRPPHAARDGMAIRNYHLLAALAREFRVKALSLADPERAYPPDWPAGVDGALVVQSARGPRRFAAAARSLLAGGAYSERLYRSAALTRRVQELAGAERPRWIVAHSYHVASAARSANAPLWVDFHNVDSEIWLRTAQTAPSALVRGFAGLQAGRVARVEAALVPSAAGISCVSARDASALGALRPRAEPLVVPNGVDPARHAFRASVPPGESVLFVGDLSWPPNADAVRWFLNAVWPRVRRARPAARAEIVGRSAPSDIVRQATADVVVAGEGGDARAHWLAAAVAVVPLRAGGGTRLKILEAAATGVPVVSTSVGAEGLAFADETEILRRDDAESFAAAVSGLLSDPGAGRRQAEAARARVEREYGWGPIGSAFARELARRGGSA